MTDRDKHFICMDVDLARHERIMSLDEPLACLGLWAAMTAYARELMSGGRTGGRVPLRVAETMCGEKNGRRLAQMVGSGLLTKTDTHYEIEKYAPRNQSPEMVLESRRKGRAWKAKSRAGHADVRPDIGQTDTGNGPDGSETGASFVPDPLSTRARAPASLSPSSSGSESERGMQGGAKVGLGDPLPPETDTILSRLEMDVTGGAEIRDIGLHWSGFCGHYDGKLWRAEVPGKWQKWLAGEFKKQQESDAKTSQRSSGAFPTHRNAPPGGLKTDRPSFT